MYFGTKKKSILFMLLYFLYMFLQLLIIAAHRHEMYLILWKGLSIHGPLPDNLLGHGPLDSQCDARNWDT